MKLLVLYNDGVDIWDAKEVSIYSLLYHRVFYRIYTLGLPQNNQTFVPKRCAFD